VSGKPLLAAVTLSVVCGACLLPQDDTILVDIPPPVNQPPAIVEAEVLPLSRIFSVDGGPGCPDLVFSAPVEDPDLLDVLYYDFYVDSDAGSTGLVAQGSVPPSGNAFRTQPASYDVDWSSPGPLQTQGTHLVEVLVADGPLVNGVPQPRSVALADGGTRIDETFAVSFSWLVTVTGGACP
jgi:hypothetical protein